MLSCFPMSNPVWILCIWPNRGGVFLLFVAFCFLVGSFAFPHCMISCLYCVVRELFATRIIVCSVVSGGVGKFASSAYIRLSPSCSFWISSCSGDAFFVCCSLF